MPIKEQKRGPIHIPNKDVYFQKLQDFKTAGKEQLFFISDFDRTLSRAYINDKEAMTLMTTLEVVPTIPKGYKQGEVKLHSQYYPIELDKSISLKEKQKQMVQWWSKHLNLFIKYQIPYSAIQYAAKHHALKFRTGVHQLFEITKKEHIPVIVFSAAVQNILHEFLINEGIEFENVGIISNLIYFNKEGIAVDYERDIIHSFNKGSVKMPPRILQLINGRTHAILMGDSLGDVQMEKNFSHKNTLKIGFINNPTEDNIKAYEKLYDILILGDRPATYITTILQQLIQ